MILICLIPIVVATTIIYGFWKHKTKISQVAEKKWETEDETIYVDYGNYKIPLRQSELPRWLLMTDKEKWYIRTTLDNACKQGKLKKIKEGTQYKYILTEKAKDIKHRMNQRENGYKDGETKTEQK